MAQQGGLNAAQIAGAQQGAQQVGAGGPPPAEPEKYNRYTAQIKEMQRNAAFGVFVPDLLKAKSNGHEDMARGIKLMIRKQYFDTNQVTRLVVTFTVVGMMISAAIYTAVWCKPDLEKYYASFGFGICAGAFSMMLYWWFVGANWEAVCSADNKDVEPELRGNECLTDADCSVGKLSDYMCVQKRPPKSARALRGSLMLGLLGGSVGFAAIASSAQWDGQTTYTGFVIGSVIGAFLFQIFPLDNHRRAPVA